MTREINVLTALRHRLRKPADEDGFALITVIGSMFVLTAVALAAFGYALSNLPQSRRTQDFNAALSAAQSGMEDFLQRLSASNSYWDVPGVKDCTNLALVSPAGACPSKPADPWVKVVNKGNSAEYQYAFFPTTDDGLRLRSTGRSKGVQRTVVADFKKKGFLQYAYFTDLETTDPLVYPRVYGVPESLAGTYCDHPYYSLAGQPDQRRRPIPGAKLPADARSNLSALLDKNGDLPCFDPAFGTADSISAGQARSNDAILVRGQPTVDLGIITSWPSTGVDPVGDPNETKRYRVDPTATGLQQPRCASALGSACVSFGGTLPLPANNDKIDTYARYQSNGCLYTGPTKIEMQNNGDVRVWSPWSQAPETSPGCLTSAGGSVAGPGKDGAGNANSLGSSFTIANKATNPEGLVIYVQDVPPTRSVPCTSSTVGYPEPGDASPIADYGCRDGNAFVKGTTKGRTTIAAKSNIFVVGSLQLQDKQTDTVGLIANKTVWAYHPVVCLSSITDKSDPGFCQDSDYTYTGGKYVLNAHPRQNTNLTIQAAIMSTGGSIQLQNYSEGPVMGTLSVYGAIVQKYRGPVAVLDSKTGALLQGYKKSYQYNPKLATSEPPQFLKPEQAEWKLQQFSEQPNP